MRVLALGVVLSMGAAVAGAPAPLPLPDTGSGETVLERALKIAREAGVETPVDECADRVRGLARRVRARAGAGASAQARVDALLHVLFEEEGYRAAGDIDDTVTLFLPSVMERKSGSCLGLSTLALAVAEIAEIPMRGVAVPNHYFVRYDDGQTRINIEMTRGGEALPDEWYVEQKRIPLEAIEAGIYLSSRTTDQTMGAILQNWALATGSGRAGRPADVDGALEVIAEALKLSPDLPEARRTLGVLRSRAGDAPAALEALGRAIGANPNDTEARLNRAVVRYGEGEVAGALADLDAALGIDRDYEAARVRLESWAPEIRENHFDLWQARAVRRHAPLEASLRPGLLGVYYEGREFEKEAARRVDRDLSFDWKSVAPHPGMPSTRFSIRWDGFLRVPVTATYSIYVAANDGVRLYLDGKRLIDNWRDHGWENIYESTEVRLDAGLHELRVEMFNNRGGSRVILLLASDAQEKSLKTAKHIFHLPENRSEARSRRP